MFDIGFAELLLIGVVGLLVIGPEQLPGAVRTTLAWVNRFRRSFDQIRTEVRRELHNDEILQNLKTESQALEQQIKAGSTSIEQGVQSLTQLATDTTEHPDSSTPPCWRTRSFSRRQQQVRWQRVNNNAEQDPPMSLIAHLTELRDRLLRAVLAIVVGFIVLFPFANEIYGFVSAPLRALMPAGSTMIATGVASPFLTPFKLSLVLAIFLAIPVILFQIWSFIAPGLYQKEKRIAVPLLASSVLLFYAGAAFAYLSFSP